MTNKSFVSLSVLLCAMALTDVTGCASDYKEPTASVQAPSTAAVGESVQLDGSGSADPNTPALPLTYEWSLASVPAGSAAQIQQSQDAKPWFTPDVAGDYVIQLVVSDGMLASQAAQVTLTAGPCGANPPVVSNVTATPAAPNTGDIVVLSATVTDDDNSATCKLNDPTTPHWALEAVPAGSNAVLSGATQDSPWFTADVPGDYIVSVYATDTLEQSASPPQTLKVTVADCGSHAPVAQILTTLTGIGNPAATGGVTLPPAFPFPNFWFGNQFNNRDLGDLCLYGWNQNTNQINCGWNGATNVGGTTFTFTGPNPAASSSTTPPPDYTVFTSGWSAVQLDGSASYDPDNQGTCNLGQNLSYQWSIVSAPAGATARWVDGSGCMLGFGGGGGGGTCTPNLSSALVNPTLNVNVAGTYRVQLAVSDGTYVSAPIFIDVNTTKTP